MRKLFVLLATAALLSGCYHATIRTGATPTAERIERGFAHAWLWGLVPPSATETAERCPNGVASVETQLSFVNQLVNLLTGGIYTPMEITAVCAAP